MISIIALIYMVIGIMVAVPFFIIGLKFGDGLDDFNEDKITDSATLVGFGLGALVGVIIWPYFVAICIYEAYFKPDED